MDEAPTDGMAMTGRYGLDGLGIEFRKLPAQDLERILALHLRYVQGQRGGVRASFKFFDLSDTSLAKRNLAGADLTGANMTGVDLSGAELKDADLRGAKDFDFP
jgi:uncharacterized protein YjbI with pentapeptide repeats